MKELKEAKVAAYKSACLAVGLTGNEVACTRYIGAVDAAINSLRADGWVLRPARSGLAPARDDRMKLLWLHECGAVVRRPDSPDGTHCPTCDPEGVRAPGTYRQLFVGVAAGAEVEVTR